MSTLAFDAGSVVATLGGSFQGQAFHQFSSAMYKARSEMNATERAISDSSARSQRSLHAIGHAAKVGAVGGIAALGVAIGYSVKKAADFEQQMSSLKSVTGASGAEMTKFKKQAMDAGAATKYSALQAAQAQTELAKGGLSTAQILGGGLKAALGLAAAGELELADAAKFTVNAMSLFAIKGKDSVHVADALATAANQTTADVSDFGMALTQGGAAAKQAGYSFDQTMVVLEALAKSGVKSSDAGTSMKTAMLHLLGPTDKAAAAAKEHNLAFINQAGSMKSAAQISSMLRRETGDMTKAQRAALFQVLAGTDGFRTLAALYDAGPDKLRRYAHGLAEQGTAAKVAAEKQDNLKGKIENLKGSVETAGIAMGSKLLPGLKQLATQATDSINAFVKSGGMDRFADGVIAGAHTAGQVIGDIVPIAKSAAAALISVGQALDLGNASHIEAILAGFVAFKVVGTLTPMVIAFGQAVRLAFLEIATASSIGAGLATLANPLLLIPAAAAAAAGALVLLSGRESDEARLARESAEAHKAQAEAIKSVQDAERAAADKGLAAQQATLDQRQAHQNTRNVLKDATAGVQERHPTWSNTHAERAAKDSDRYKTALIAEQQAALRNTSAHKDYQKSLDDQHGKVAKLTDDAQKRLTAETELNAKLRNDKQTADAVFKADPFAGQGQRDRVNKELEASNKRLALSTRDYMQAQARAAVTDASRTRLMNQSSQITTKNAASIANLIGFINLMPKSKQTRILLSDQNVLARIGSIVGALRNVVPRKQIQVILSGAETAKSALKAMQALQAGVNPKTVANIVTNSKTEKGEISGLQRAINKTKGKSGVQIKTTARAETTAVHQLQGAIDGLRGKEVHIKVVKDKVTGSATGRKPGKNELSMVGEGTGAELVGNPKDGFARVNSPTLMPLGAADWVLPVEQYPQRAMRMWMDMLGLRGYSGGKGGKKKRPIPKSVYLGHSVEFFDSEVSHLEQVAQQKDKNNRATAKAKRAKKQLAEMKRVKAQAHAYDARVKKHEDEANIQRDNMSAADSRDDVGGYRRAWKSRRSELQRARTLLRNALKFAAPGSKYHQDVRARIATLNTYLDDMTGDKAGSPLEAKDAAPQTFTKDEQKRLDKWESQIALASLDPAVNDADKDPLKARERFLSGLLGVLQATPALAAARGGAPAITQIANELRDTRQTLKDLNNPNVTADQQASADQQYQRGLAAGQTSFIDRLTAATVQGAGPSLVFQSYVPPSPSEARRLADHVVSGVDFQGGRPASTQRIGV